jgi:hypothetical protein
VPPLKGGVCVSEQLNAASTQVQVQPLPEVEGAVDAVAFVYDRVNENGAALKHVAASLRTEGSILVAAHRQAGFTLCAQGEVVLTRSRAECP